MSGAGFYHQGEGSMEKISDEGLGERVPISESKKRGFLKEELFTSRGSTVRRGFQEKS